jgi:hypothetical protein
MSGCAVWNGARRCVKGRWPADQSLLRLPHTIVTPAPALLHPKNASMLQQSLDPVFA